MQGDQYYIPFSIKFDDGSVADGGTFDDVEIVLGGIRKTMSGGAVTYDVVSGSFLFPITQAESFKLIPGTPVLQIRVKPKESSDVIGVYVGPVSVTKSESKAVL